ncbi:hypothetical protein, partial [Fangia hongkongensis]|uniref:hypothetical protein n=1 Tax=Fangia hongkongensis TaxID=270495 RepID=UPI0005591993
MFESVKRLYVLREWLIKSTYTLSAFLFIPLVSLNTGFAEGLQYVNTYGIPYDNWVTLNENIKYEKAMLPDLQKLSQYKDDIKKNTTDVGINKSALSALGNLTGSSKLVETLNGDGKDKSGLISDVSNLSKTVGSKADNTGIFADIKSNAEGISANKGSISKLQGTVGDKDSGLVKDVTSLTTAVGNKDSGLVKSVTDNSSSISSLSGQIGNGSSG